MAEANVKLVLTAEDRTSGAFRGATTSTNKWKSSVEGLLPVLGVAGLAGAVGGLIKSTAEFEKQLTDVSTLISGDSTQAINEMREGINDILRSSPKSAQELGSAAYAIVSAGINETSDALKTLAASEDLAVAGLGSVQEATDLVTSAINAFGYEARQADDIADILFKTVKAGKTTVSELAQSFGNVAPLAKTAGVSLEDLQAATAALTTSGVKTSVAQTQLRASMQALLKPTKEMSELFDALGVSSGQELLKTTNGLGDAFFALGDAADGNVEVLGKAFGSVEALNAVLALTGESAGTYVETLKGMTDGTNAIDEAVKKQNEDLLNQYNILKNQLGVELRTLAVATFPALSKALQGVSVFFQALSLAIEETGKVLGSIIYQVQQLIQWIDKLFSRLDSRTSGFVDSLKSRSLVSAIGGAFGDLVGRQSGGIVNAGRPYLVGEAGPEMFIPASSGSIVPNSRMSGGGGVVINITGNSFLGEDDMAERVGNRIIDVLKMNNKI